MLDYVELTDLLTCAMVNRRFFWLAYQTFDHMTALDCQPLCHHLNNRVLYYLASKLKHLQQLSLAWAGDSSSDGDALVTADGFARMLQVLQINR